MVTIIKGNGIMIKNMVKVFIFEIIKGEYKYAGSGSSVSIIF
jgi:hypothetical protein